jgi:hypothetical protein
MRKRLWIAATILSALALLGTAAGAANSGADLTSLDLDSVVASVASNAASSMATQASQQTTEADKHNNNNDNNEVATETNENDDPVISASTEAAPSGTTSTKPGWGCGDTNHEHSGPPGRPGATPPPGCDKAGGNGQSGTNGNNASNGTGQQSVNPSHSNPGKGKGKP